MARKKQASFKMKGHTLPGINQNSETKNLKDGRSPSSALQQKSSPNKILGAGLVNPILKGVKNLFGGAGGDDEGDDSGKLLEDTGKTITKTTGFTVSGGGGGTDVAAGTTMPEPGAGTTMATNKPDEVLTMKSPNKKKLKSGTDATVGGGFGGVLYKPGTSPHSK